MEHGATRDIGRLNAFTDGVMVVSMTLLVLNIDLPQAVAGLEGSALLGALADLFPRLLGYVLSFIVVANYWMGYTQKLGNLRSVDERFTQLNIYFLLVIGFVPFSTALISENDGSVPTAIYAATMVLASFLLCVLWLYANAKGFLGEPIRAGRRWREIGPWLQIAAVFGASIPVAFLHSGAAKFMWFLLAVPVFKSKPSSPPPA